jgi:hypothetical protein
MQKGVTEYPIVVGVRLSHQQADQLRQLARQDDRPTSVLLRRIITTALAKKRKEGARMTS